jgi:D-serine deaminase-like pyridoxal phosphate-dependent protein
MEAEPMGAIGKSLTELDTPALWVELDRMEANIRYLAGYFQKAGVAWRPHTKGIKIPAIAHHLLQAGAIGITCAKLGEAEVMAAAGIRDILVANQVVGAQKVTRLVNLRRQADVMVAVDNLDNVAEISRAATDAGMQVRVLIEINSGMDRAGLEPGPGVVDFARQVLAYPGIQLAGLMAWEGHVVGIEDPQEKRQRCEASVGLLLHSVDLCRQSGITVTIVSCGGSGSYPITAQIPGVTEIQAGGAIFGDVTYRRWGAGTQEALFILATVTSRPAAGRAVIDAGRKTMNGEISMPEVQDFPGARLVSLSAEHGVLELDASAAQLKVGRKLNFAAGYGDFTVFMHDRLVGVRNGKVEVVWVIQGRGKIT